MSPSEARPRGLAEAIAAEASGRPGTAVLAPLEEFVLGAVGDLTEDEYSFLVRAADLAFMAERYELADALYGLLSSRGRAGEGGSLRRVHVRILLGRPEEALGVLAELEPEVGFSLNGDRLRALALLDLGRARDAIPVLRAVIARAPEDAAFLRVLVRALQESGETARLAEVDEAATRLPNEAERFEIRVRTRVAAGDLAGLERLYGEYPPEVIEAAADQLGQLIRELTSSGQHETAGRLLALTGIRGASNGNLAVAALGHFFLEGDWDSAGEWLAAGRTVVSAEVEPFLKLRKLQYLCFTLQLEDAAELAATWSSVEDMPKEAVPVIAALYASLGRWDGIVELLRECVDHAVPIDADAFLETVGLAARRTRRYAEVAELLVQSGGDAGPAEGPNRLLDRLGVETSLLALLGLIDSGGAARPIEHPFFAERADSFRRLVHARAGDAGPEAAPAGVGAPAPRDSSRTILFCADRRYLLGACVAVSSLLRHNPFAAAGPRVLAVCDDGVVGLATEALGSVGARFGTLVEVLPAGELLAESAGRGLRPDWGLFTHGHTLSEAAYYRLFAVKKLVDEGNRGRVLYLDSDTCVAHGVDEFFTFPLAGRPLAARYELATPSIAQAARKLGLDREMYFNSGVLLFDLQHPELPNALGEAVANAVERPELLMFHDQCALNLAFRDLVTPLPDRLNYYVRQADELGEADPAVWHYLTPWKPWDPQYGSENCRIWDRELAALAEIVPSRVVAELLACQFAPTA